VNATIFEGIEIAYQLYSGRRVLFPSPFSRYVRNGNVTQQLPHHLVGMCVLVMSHNNFTT